MRRLFEVALERACDVSLLAGLSLAASNTALAADRPQRDPAVDAAYEAHAEVGNGEMRPVATEWLAETLVHSHRCDEAEAVLSRDDGIREPRIQQVVNAAVDQDDLACAARLARLQLARPDPAVSPASLRTRLRLEGGAVLRAAGHPDGTGVIRDAESELTRESAAAPAGKTARGYLWLARLRMHWINEGTALFMPTLEAHARELAADATLAEPATVNGFVRVLVGAGRTDLAEAILQSPAGNPDRYASLASVTADLSKGRGYDPQPPHCPDLVQTEGLRPTMDEIAAIEEPLDRLAALRNLARQSWLARCGIR